jgi:hypothetical protein
MYYDKLLDAALAIMLFAAVVIAAAILALSLGV